MTTKKKATKKPAKKKPTKKPSAYQVGQHVLTATGSRPWLVTMGRYVAHSDAAITLKDVRCAVYYGVETRGVLGLASRGPSSDSRITGTCPGIKVRWEMIAEMTPEAVAAWEKEPWS